MPTTRARRKNSVSVQYAVPRRGVPSAASFRKWAALRPAQATIRIVGQREGRRLNRIFRRKNFATNVLSFPYGPGRGDLVLCHPVIAREARAQRKTIAAHYAHLVLHGLLHLRGYDHEKKREAERMERAEIRLLRRAGYGNPYTVE
ncbi:MAG: rRNA maturation RNase YbeY [Betaproteobacteria bacterium RIFCSPLOWO2_12_FULL_65_14]|nr:MAG: rRNA maturation RNase YbeY [Betaproteobacteria bacterium RIFCSPLOWO2_12_FULL_65_14]